VYCQNKVIIYQISDMQLIPLELQPTLSMLRHKAREACLINYKEAKLFHVSPDGLNRKDERWTVPYQSIKFKEQLETVPFHCSPSPEEG